MNFRRFAGVSMLLLSLVACLSVWWYREGLYDWYRLQNYTPPARIIQLADDTTMSDYSRRVFFANHPQVNDKAAFNANCRDNEHTIVLGCFIENRGIFLLKVEDPRLDGVEEVTAAHETLHAVYSRLSTKERTAVDKLVTEAYQDVKTQELSKTVELYRKKDANIVPNELHSILGTEVRTLPASLEKHYAQYFKDRLAVVAFAERYNQVFINERNQVIEFDAQLAALKNEIESLERQLNKDSVTLDERRSSLNAMRAAGDIEGYNAAVPVYNSLVNNYNAKAEQLRSLIARYNAIVPKRNAIATEQQALVEAIDSRNVKPAP